MSRTEGPLRPPITSATRRITRAEHVAAYHTPAGKNQADVSAAEHNRMHETGQTTHAHRHEVVWTIPNVRRRKW